MGDLLEQDIQTTVEAKGLYHGKQQQANGTHVDGLPETRKRTTATLCF